MNPHYMGVLFRFKVPERIKAQEKETIFVYSGNGSRLFSTF